MRDQNSGIDYFFVDLYINSWSKVDFNSDNP